KSGSLFFFMLIAKENMGFWLGPLALILAFEPLLSRKARIAAGVMGVIGIVYSLFMIGLVMPSFSTDATYAHFDYGILGSSITEIPAAIIQRPAEILKALFVDHKGVPNGTSIKLEFWWMLLLSGGWAFFLRPRWGLMALPLIAQKMWHDDPGKWSVIAQYGVEFAPLLGVAVPLAIGRISNEKITRILPMVAVILSLICTIRFMDRTVAYHDRSRIRIYQAQHYVKPYDLDQVKEAMELIPPDASVSAQSPAVPHLALRNKIYQFPIMKDADHILLLPQESPYPLDTAQYYIQMERLSNDPEWRTQLRTENVILFSRNEPPSEEAR
nr:DUF2079 domain-containing protein [Bacteroidota bacterium]